MAIDTSGSGVHGRRNSNRGSAYSYVRKGQEQLAKWPKGRGKRINPKTLAQMNFFRMVQWVWKYTDATQQIAYTKACKGTPILPRDVFLMAYSGRQFAIIDTNGHTWWSMPAKKNVSDSLDVIAQLPGNMLARDVDGWKPIDPPTEASMMLVSVAPDQPPIWVPISAIPGAVPWWWHPPTVADLPYLAAGGGNTMTLADDDDIGLVVTASPGGTGDGYTFAGQGLDAAGNIHWRAECFISPDYDLSPFQTLVLAALESSSTKMLHSGLGFNGNIVMAAETATLGTWSGDFGPGTQGGYTGSHFAIEYDPATGDISAQLSSDGKHWGIFDTRPVTSVFNVRPDYIGISAGPQGPSGTFTKGSIGRFVVTYP